MRRLVLAALLAVAPASVRAQSGNVQASLIAAGDAAIPGLPLDVGIRLRMRPGWHVYWKNPGDSGLPPKVTWTLPEGFEAGPIEWPTPERFLEEEMMTYGYDDEVVLPIRIQVPYPLPRDSVAIAARVDWLECKDICLPGSATLRLVLPVRAERRLYRPSERFIAKARSRLPATGGWVLMAESGPRAVSLSFKPPHGAPRSAYFYADRPLLVDYAAPQGFERLGQLWRVTMKPAPNEARNLDRLTGVLVTNGEGGSRAVQVDVPMRSGDPAPATPQPLMPRRTPSAVIYAVVLAGLVAVLALLVFVLRTRSS